MMTSLFAQVFACCLRERPKQRTREPDERTRLIPDADDTPQPAQRDVLVADQQKVKEQLRTIVRSKEGKMVNVNSHVPFNLHNKPFYAQLHASSSRSGGRSFSTRAQHDLLHTHTPATGTPEVTPPSEVDRERSPHPSLSTTRSTASLHQGTVSSYLSPEPSGPILNVRLVRGTGMRTRRGRSRRRARFGDESPRRVGAENLEEGERERGEEGAVRRENDSREGSDRVRDKSLEEEDEDEGEQEEIDVDTSSAIRAEVARSGEVVPEVTLLSDDDRETITLLSNEISTTLREGFKIHDAGEITRGWGD